MKSVPTQRAGLFVWSVSPSWGVPIDYPPPWLDSPFFFLFFLNDRREWKVSQIRRRSKRGSAEEQMAACTWMLRSVMCYPWCRKGSGSVCVCVCVCVCVWLRARFQPTQGQTGSSAHAHETLLFPHAFSFIYLPFSPRLFCYVGGWVCHPVEVYCLHSVHSSTPLLCSWTTWLKYLIG